MRITVTGAAGNVGSYVHRWLAERGHDVLGVDVKPGGVAGLEYRVADLTSYRETAEVLRGSDRVVHLAGIPAPILSPEWHVHNVNTTISYNVLLASADLGISRVVQSSSVNAIGLAWSRKPVFDYFPIDVRHATRNEDGYSLSKLVQELQAASVARRYDTFSAISLRLHAVVADAEQARSYEAMLGEHWAVDGLFGYCTFESVASAFELGLTAPVAGSESLWVVEPETFRLEPSAQLAEQYFPQVTLTHPLVGRESFFDTSRTAELLGWTASSAGGGRS